MTLDVGIDGKGSARSISARRQRSLRIRKAPGIRFIGLRYGGLTDKTRVFREETNCRPVGPEEVFSAPDSRSSGTGLGERLDPWSGNPWTGEKCPDAVSIHEVLKGAVMLPKMSLSRRTQIVLAAFHSDILPPCVGRGIRHRDKLLVGPDGALTRLREFEEVAQIVRVLGVTDLTVCGISSTCQIRGHGFKLHFWPLQFAPSFHRGLFLPW